MSTGLLDDLLDAETLERVKAQRAKRQRTDLSDLLAEAPPKPPAIEILPPYTVILHVQENHCACGRISEIPLGLTAMHPCKRHGRKSDDRIGVALTAGNEFPHLPREREVHRGTSLVCADCVETARLVPQVTAPTYHAPRPGTPEWSEQFGYMATEEVRAYEERLRRTDERLNRLETIAEDKIITASFDERITQMLASEEPEITLPEDSQ